MGTGIIICGCNGSGKSTLGRALATELQCRMIDIERCYFAASDVTYSHPRSREEAEAYLLQEIRQCRSFVLAAVKGDFNKEICASYQQVLLLHAPAALRWNRLQARSFQKFGNRMLPGGDLYEQEQQFFLRAIQRSETEIERWVDSIGCPVIHLDGTKSVAENVANYMHNFSDHFVSRIEQNCKNKGCKKDREKTKKV